MLATLLAAAPMQAILATSDLTKGVLAMRVTFGNLKGGVAKSTSSVYAALGLAAAGGRVLLVDADATNRTCLRWSTLAPDWPASVTVVSWEVEDLARRVQAMQGYDHVVIDTGPQRPTILRQALLVTDDLVIPVAPSPVELEQLADTFTLAAEVDAVSPTFTQALFVKVRRGTRSSVEARRYLTDHNLPVMDAEVHLLETYSLAYGTVPVDLGEYAEVVKELASEDGA
jgi:chromosome partitioning protein